jgi:predicted membrane protein
MTSKTIATLIGVIFIAVGILGYIDNPIVGDSANAIFHADSTHNMVHIVSGVLFLLVAMAAPAAASGFMIVFGLVYLALGVLGMTSIGDQGMTTLVGFLHVNGNDNYLHIALGLVILIAGFATRRRVARAG